MPGAPSLMVDSFPSRMGLADPFGTYGRGHAPRGSVPCLAGAAALPVPVLYLVRNQPMPRPMSFK